MFAEAKRAPIQRRVYAMYATAVRTAPNVFCNAYSRPLPAPPLSERLTLGEPAQGGNTVPRIPRIVWIYWDQEKQPAFVAAVIDRIREQAAGFEVRVINRQSVRQYVADIDSWREDLPKPNFADLIRLHLLRDYGGIWIDATAMPGGGLDWVIDWAENDGLGFIAFFNRGHSRQVPHPVVENWFLAAAPDNEFINEWLRLLSPLESRPKIELYDALLAHESCQRLSEVIPDPFYRIPYLVAQRVFETLDKPHMGLVAADDEAFYCFGPAARHSWDVAINMLVRPDFEVAPLMVKFTNRERMIVDAFLSKDAIFPRSMVGRLLGVH